MNYRPFLFLIASARRTELWRLVLGVVLVVVVMIGLSQVLMALLAMALSPGHQAGFLQLVQTADTPMGLMVLLFSMGTMGVGVALAAQVVHQRPLITLLGPLPLFLRQFLRVLAAMALLQLAVLLLPPWPPGDSFLPGLAPGRWLLLLPFTLIALTVQTASEELFFRGYLQSQLAARLPNPIVWLTVPSLLFALGHLSPAIYGANAGLVAGWAFLFGLAAADLTARAGTLGPAIAMHLANNCMAIAITAPQGSMSGLALLQLPFDPTDESAVRAMLPVDLLTLFLSWLAARLALRV